VCLERESLVWSVNGVRARLRTTLSTLPRPSLCERTRAARRRQVFAQQRHLPLELPAQLRQCGREHREASVTIVCCVCPAVEPCDSTACHSACATP
jgi:hypothetical protein